MAPSEQILHSASARHRHGDGHIGVEGRGPLPYAAAPGGADGDGGYDPEQLYAAALAGCLHQALLVAATETGTDPAGSSVQAEVRLHTDHSQHYRFTASARMDLPSVDGALRDRVIDLALRMCPVSDQVVLDRA